jgi:hypothetical protein
MLIRQCRCAPASCPCSRLWWSLGFGDENTRIDLWLDTSSSAHVRWSLLEGLSYELCIFHLFQSFTLWLVVSEWSQVRLVVSRSQCLEVSVSGWYSGGYFLALLGLFVWLSLTLNNIWLWRKYSLETIIIVIIYFHVSIKCYYLYYNCYVYRILDSEENSYVV